MHRLARPAKSNWNHAVVIGQTTYQNVFNDRKRRIRGSWKRNGCFYARLNIMDSLNGHKATRQVRLAQCSTVAAARIACRICSRTAASRVCRAQAQSASGRLLG